jgi:type VI secretion system protein ImpA
MASALLIELDDYLHPISNDKPAGEDIREDASPTSIYYQIKDARNSARAAERASMFDSDEGANVIQHWKPIVSLAPSIIKDHSKDLEVVSWYIEAMLRLEGFSGLKTGLALANALVQNFWEDLYPQPDEDGIETKVAPLAGLNGDSGEGTLIAPLRNAPITPEGDKGDFNFWQYQQARDADKIADEDKKQQKIEALGFSLTDIETLVIQTPDQYFVDLTEDIQACLDSYDEMNGTLRSHCGHEAPPFTLIKNTLDEILRTIRFLAKDKLLAAAQEDSSMDSSEVTTDSKENTAAPEQQMQSPAQIKHTSGPVSSREDAFKKMQEACDFFRANEPHTPLVSALERLIRWGHMTLPELMAELMPDPTSRAFYTQLTGANLEQYGNENSAGYTGFTPPATNAPSNSISTSSTPENTDSPHSTAAELNPAAEPEKSGDLSW